MRKILYLFVLLMSISVSVLGYNSTYAVIISVADYKNFTPDDGDLKYAVNDAVSFADFLKSKKGGSVPEVNIVLLTDAQASKADIIAKSKALFAKAKKNDRVIFFFSGHGSRGCFMPYDAGDIGNNLIYFHEIKSIFRCAKCNTKLLFADACHAGSMKKGLSSNVELNETSVEDSKVTSNLNIAVMMSCQSDERSLECSDLANGLFTYYLKEGLSGKANRDGNQYITIQELYYYVYHNVQDMAALRGRSQTPELFGKFDLRLIVAKV